MKPSEVLAKAADLIEPVGRWTQGHSARDAAGHLVSPQSPLAVCWCALGATDHVSSDSDAWFRLYAVIGDVSVSTWNDEEGRTQAEVVAALRRAASLAKAEGQ